MEKKEKKEKFEYSIKDANNEINRVTNILNLYLDRKNLLFNETQPKAQPINPDKTDGSTTREERFLKYVYKCDDEELEWWIDNLNVYLSMLSLYVERELKRIGEYEPLKAKIIKLREEEHMKIKDIAEATHYSESQIKRILKEFKNKRYIDD